MVFLVYYLILKPISLLPLPILYVLADGLYLTLYRLVGFRKKVVWNNLKQSFPEKTENDLREIMDRFYHHLCDILVESLHMFSMSENEALKRFKVKNPELLVRHFKARKSVLMATGHYNNWEWLAMTLHPQVLHTAVGIYNPLRNRFFEKKVRNSRGKFGMVMVPKKESVQFFETNRELRGIYMLPIDQSPTWAKRVYWMQFLGQDTAVFFGTEKFAKMYDYPVIYAHVYKIRRGYYECIFEEITDNPKEAPHGLITETHTRLLERNILSAPEYWLWSHKRWKRKRETDIIQS